MDKYEYKIRAEEIKSLIAEGEFAEAVKIADTIDWRRVRSVMMLCTISDLYKINRRYQESKDILLLAYEKHPTGRLIVYSLCELSIKMEDFVQAVEYYKEFMQIAPKDTGQYVLLYRLYEAQNVSLEERIAVLEEFKKRDYREKWAYELAYLYHRIGLVTKCIDECDEMYLWFGEGKYVIKALELKALHVPLNEEQQIKYDAWVARRELGIEDDEEIEEEEEEEESEEMAEETEEEQELPSVPTTELPEVKTVDVGQYNTLNLQMVLAESMKEIMTEEEAVSQEQPVIEEEEPSSIAEKIIAPLLEETGEMPGIGVQQNTDELSEIGFQSQQESAVQYDPPEQEMAVQYEEPESVMQYYEPEQETVEQNGEPESVVQYFEPVQEVIVQNEEPESIVPHDELEQEIAASHNEPELESSARDSAPEPVVKYSALRQESAPQSPSQQMKRHSLKYDDVLTQEYDGQIRLVIPDVKKIEKQITGQLSIEDIMAEWEQMKKTNEQKRMEDIRQRIFSQTGGLLKDFDEATKSGLLEQLEKAFFAALMQEVEGHSGTKQAAKSNPVEADMKIAPEPEVKIAPKPEPPQQIKKQKVVPEPKPEPIPEIQDAAEDIVEAVEEAKEETAIESTVSEAVNSDESAKTEEQKVRPKQNYSGTDRELTNEEQEIFGQYINNKKTKGQLIYTLDNMSMASYTGNVLISGEESSRTLALAKDLIREMQYNDSNFSGKVAKVSAAVLNKKDVASTLKRLTNGALIIEGGADLKQGTVTRLGKVLETDNVGLLLILEDTKKRIDKLLSNNEILKNSFNLRVDIAALDNEALVAYAKKYAEEMEYSIDEFGVLALHTQIADRQTSDHEVSVTEVKGLVDEAIRSANRKTPKHFFDILLAKRYDQNDMIILRENDFMQIE